MAAGEGIAGTVRGGGDGGTVCRGIVAGAGMGSSVMGPPGAPTLGMGMPSPPGTPVHPGIGAPTGGWLHVSQSVDLPVNR